MLIEAIEMAKRSGVLLDVMGAMDEGFVDQAPEAAEEIARLLIQQHSPRVCYCQECVKADEFHLWCAEEATRAQ